MDPQPRSASYRVLASLSYLPPVAVAILLSPTYRPVRLLRQHALQSLALMILGFGGAVVIGWTGSILGALPGIGFGLLTMSGLAITLWMIVTLSGAVLGAIAAYQGRAPRLPGLDRQFRKLDRWIEARHVQSLGEPARRRRKGTGRA